MYSCWLMREKMESRIRIDMPATDDTDAAKKMVVLSGVVGQVLGVKCSCMNAVRILSGSKTIGIFASVQEAEKQQAGQVTDADKVVAFRKIVALLFSSAETFGKTLIVRNVCRFNRLAKIADNIDGMTSAQLKEELEQSG